MAQSIGELTKTTDRGSYEIYSPAAHRGRLPDLGLVTIGRVLGKRERVRRRGTDPAIALVHRGGGWLAFAGAEPQQIMAPALIWLPSGSIADYWPDPWWDERFVIFRGSRVDAWLRAGWLQQSPAWWCPAEPASAVHHHQRAMQACADPQADHDRIDGAKLAIESVIHASRPGQPSGSVEQALAAWRSDPGGANLATAAAQAGLSPSRFRTVVRAKLGRAPAGILQAERIALACNRLLAGDEPLKAIAHELGFGRVETFIRAFQRERGCSPGAWRRQMRGEVQP